MAYDKLEQIKDKKAKYKKLNLIFAIPMFLSLFFVLFNAVIWKVQDDVSNIYIMFGAVAVFVIFMILSTIFAAKELRYTGIMEDYIINKVLNLITESGIESTKIKLIDEKDRYKIAFHNQMVDYDTLQRKINELLKTLNSISGMAVVVDLI